MPLPPSPSYLKDINDFQLNDVAFVLFNNEIILFFFFLDIPLQYHNKTHTLLFCYNLNLYMATKGFEMWPPSILHWKFYIWAVQASCIGRNQLSIPSAKVHTLLDSLLSKGE